MSFDAIVLAGGEARRMGGTDKADVVVGGRSLLQRVLDAVAAAEQVVVVGSERPVARPITFVTEDPPGGGPVPALRAGLERTSADRVVVLACDMPFVTRSIVSRLLSAIGDADGAMLRDGEGRVQPLASAWSSSALRRALGGPAGRAGTSLSGALGGLSTAVLDEVTASFDCDTTEDVMRARRITEGADG
jgi:molybdopterin-guanine dinucleotide biosynthesis protein A